jgi:hypothetical protein
MTRCLSQKLDHAQDEQTWQDFVRTVKQLHSWDSAGYPAEAHSLARKMLGIEEEKYDWGCGHKLIVADSPFTEVSVKPQPDVWRTADQILICSADLCGGAHPEYVLGMGWMGPAGGVLCVYDSSMRKLAGIDTYCIWGLSLRDLINDGKNEIICWSDEHPGTGEWLRCLTIYKYYDGFGLKTIWQGELYAEVLGKIDKYDIEIKNEKDRPAVILKKHVISEYKIDNVVRKKQLQPLETYNWNSKTRHFER